MENHKRIVVCGSVIYDKIQTFKGEIIKSFGGITYSIITLAQLLPDYEIVPLTWISDTKYQEFKKFLSQYQNVNLNYIKKVEKMSHNFLLYTSPEERIEFMEIVEHSLEIKDLLPFLDNSQVFLINYTMYSDVPYETLKWLANAFRNLIYIDIHSLVRRKKGEKFVPTYEIVPKWGDYVLCGDIIQMNKEELSYFSGFIIKEKEDIERIVSLMFMINRALKGVHITLGSEGSYGMWKEEERYESKFFKTKETEGDVTGCGDVFGSAFLSHYLKTKNFEKSTEFAHKIVLQKLKQKGVNFKLCLNGCL